MDGYGWRGATPRPQNTQAASHSASQKLEALSSWGCATLLSGGAGGGHEDPGHESAGRVDVLGRAAEGRRWRQLGEEARLGPPARRSLATAREADQVQGDQGARRPGVLRREHQPLLLSGRDGEAREEEEGEAERHKRIPRAPSSLASWTRTCSWADQKNALFFPSTL